MPVVLANNALPVSAIVVNAVGDSGSCSNANESLEMQPRGEIKTPQLWGSVTPANQSM